MNAVDTPVSVPFALYEGCGNDFILIDNRTLHLPDSFYPAIPTLCRNIGTDGLILLESSHSSDYRMRIFNADGTEAEMCGNGIRCLGRFIHSLGDHRPILEIETMERQLTLTIDRENIHVNMGIPCDLRWALSIPIGNRPLTAYHVNTGVPHLITFEWEGGDFEAFGRTLRHHPLFAPHGANVSVATFVPTEHLIDIRTYERGVEAETQACGTAAAAAAFITSRLYNIALPLTVRPPSGGLLQVDLSPEGALTIAGPANLVLEATIELPIPQNIEKTPNFAPKLP